jgi:putative oxidoreductase
MGTSSIFQDVRTWGTQHVANHSFLEALIVTDDSSSQVVARLALGLVMFPHGAQKALGWFGGPGMPDTIALFQKMGISPFLGGLAVVAEFLGAIGLITGFFARLSAFGILCTMLVATWMVHVPNGLFMNWSGLQAGEGIEFHLLAMALALIVFFAGAGRFSIDREIYRKTRGV